MPHQPELPKIDAGNTLPNPSFLSWLKGQTTLFISQILGLLSVVLSLSYYGSGVWEHLRSGAEAFSSVNRNIQIFVDFAHLVILFVFIVWLITVLEQNDQGRYRVGLVYKQVFNESLSRLQRRPYAEQPSFNCGNSKNIFCGSGASCGFCTLPNLTLMEESALSHAIRFFAFFAAMLCAVPVPYAPVNSARNIGLSNRSFADEVLQPSIPYWGGGLISRRKPDGLVFSTGNLYFTSHDAVGATVWRMSPTTTAIGEETILYWEQGARFGDIIFADVGGTFFGYFFAAKTGNDFAGVTIDRVPLGGGPTGVLANVGTTVDYVNKHRNLVTDGKNLYWQDEKFVRMMPIGGGAITNLDQLTGHTPSAGLALQDGKLLIYVDGDTIRYIPLTGTYVSNPSYRTIAVGTTFITALHAVHDGIYWGEKTGLVKLKVGNTVTTLQTTFGEPTSISTDGSSDAANRAWIKCDGHSCKLTIGTNTLEVYNHAFGVTVLSPGNVFWGDDSGIRLITY